MALILDTRFLLAHTFPPTREDRDKIAKFTAKTLQKEKIAIPSIVAVEYIKIAGRKIGKTAATTRLNAWLNYGAEYIPLTKQAAIKAGTLLLAHPNVPTADAIISAIALTLRAKIVSDDPHFDALGAPKIWYK